MTTLMNSSIKKAHNDAMRTLGYNPTYYIMVDDVYRDKEGVVVIASGRCGCKGRTVSLDIGHNNLGDVCDRCGKPYSYTQRRQYL